MDSRAPRANRGAGVKRQGCYRPDAVSVGPKGHESRHSLSISRERRRRLGYAASGIANGTSFCQTAQTMRPSLFAIGNRGFVVAAPIADGQRPVMQARQRLRRGAARRWAMSEYGRGRRA